MRGVIENILIALYCEDLPILMYFFRVNRYGNVVEIEFPVMSLRFFSDRSAAAENRLIKFQF